MAKKKAKKGNNSEAEKRHRELSKVNMEAAAEFQPQDKKRQTGQGNPKNQKK
ncbi:hypothetical protein OW763_15870 [Clostridium aestuarii]|uniref:Small, acid-soluble spore protein, alpha/beta type n=1 Tax=Clostridium aestuarii TaxID=338193 RepID=A0ABT4D710_9CLOT|nr:hypothetical protein [Clostridium aestuarii]MCY6485798.1 hypothetical protein [Clostridium aestuarii]